MQWPELQRPGRRDASWTRPAPSRAVNSLIGLRDALAVSAGGHVQENKEISRMQAGGPQDWWARERPETTPLPDPCCTFPPGLGHLGVLVLVLVEWLFTPHVLVLLEALLIQTQSLSAAVRTEFTRIITSTSISSESTLRVSWCHKSGTTGTRPSSVSVCVPWACAICHYICTQAACCLYGQGVSALRPCLFHFAFSNTQVSRA